jgi:hypothetical protein
MVRFPLKAKTPVVRGLEKIVRWQCRDHLRWWGPGCYKTPLAHNFILIFLILSCKSLYPELQMPLLEKVEIPRNLEMEYISSVIEMELEIEKALRDKYIYFRDRYFYFRDRFCLSLIVQR